MGSNNVLPLAEGCCVVVVRGSVGWAWVLLMGVAPWTGGCVLGLPFLPANVTFGSDVQRELIDTAGRARFYHEPGIADAQWLEFDRANEPGAVGGYLSLDVEPSASLIIMLDGASTFREDGEVGGSRDWHMEETPTYRARGFRTWSLAVRECGTAYGQGDLADLIEAIDWLDAEGKALLGVERVYVFGFSTGATIAALANLQRAVTAVVVVGGLYEPDQLEANGDLYELITSVSPLNEGLCQMAWTLDFYGAPGSPAWDALDTVSRVDQIKSPMFLLHGSSDGIFEVTNTIHLEQAYREHVMAGAVLPPLEFYYVLQGGHGAPKENPLGLARILSYLERFEP